ncbi:MAG: DEAD/DEAH box helicase family protein [Candidatus Shapirobacteria bacterium]
MSISAENIKLYRSLFDTRDDVFARYWEDLPKKKSGYAPVFRLNQSPLALTDSVIQSHLDGKQVIGVYPLFPDNTTTFLAIDFDGPDWLILAQKVTIKAFNNDLFCAIERSKSGNGGHVWFFFNGQIPAHLARQMGKLLLNQAGVQDRKTFDRMFPSQDEHTGKGYGNLICLPLNGKFVTNNTTVFINSDGQEIPDQWQYLQSIRRTSLQEINQYLQLSSNKTIDDLPNQPDENVEELPVTTTQNQETKLILGSNIFIPSTHLPDKLYKYLKKELNFPNPDFYTKERFGYSTWNTPRFIKTLERLPDGIGVPLGFLEKLNKFCQKEQIKIEAVDNRVTTKQVRFPSKLILRKDQKQVLHQLLPHDRVILEAQPGFGKTMVALALMKKLGQKTLIIVHTNTLLHQWQKRITDYFSLSKLDIGIIGDNKWSVGKKVTIASYMTLSRRGVDEIKNDFGLIIIDECHHAPANTFSTVVRQFPSKHVLGLTATTYRKDKLEKLMFLYVSYQIVKATTENIDNSENSNQIVKTDLITRKTQFKANVKLEDFQEACRLVISDPDRNNQITDDIIDALNTGAKCLVLTERLDHCHTLLDLIRQ